MQLSIKNIPSQSFCEVPQKSPLLWSVLFVDDAGNAEGQHGWWKCKDFLNDSVVYLRTGKEFPMYGYKNKLKLNEDGAYVALKNIPKFFEENLGYLNTWLVERNLEPITWHEHDGNFGVQAVIGIPTDYWQSTFTISAITSLIRCCVYKQLVNNIDELFNEEPTLNGYIDSVKKIFIPDNMPMFKQLIYKNYQYDGSNVNTPNHTIHNAGLQSWINSPGLLALCK